MKSDLTIEQWIEELKAAGWIKWRNHSTIWQAPDGRIYRGPFKAWCVMSGNEHLLDRRDHPSHQ